MARFDSHHLPMLTHPEPEPVAKAIMALAGRLPVA
jgi:hypothetical protein